MESLSTIRGRKLFETRGKPVFALYPVLAKDYGGEGRYIITLGKEGIDVEEIKRAPTVIEVEVDDG